MAIGIYKNLEGVHVYFIRKWWVGFTLAVWWRMIVRSFISLTQLVHDVRKYNIGS